MSHFNIELMFEVRMIHLETSETLSDESEL